MLLNEEKKAASLCSVVLNSHFSSPVCITPSIVRAGQRGKTRIDILLTSIKWTEGQSHAM